MNIHEPIVQLFTSTSIPMISSESVRAYTPPDGGSEAGKPNTEHRQLVTVYEGAWAQTKGP